jgi:hypothetical protein
MSWRAFSTRTLCAAAGVASALALTGIAGASPARAAQPWWHLTVSSRPSSLKAGAGRSEVQEITVTPENEVFQLKINEEAVGLFESSPYPFGKFPHATAANVQAALESASAYGPGNVIVTGQGAEGLPPLIVTMVNGQANRPVSALEVVSGPPETAEAQVVTPGRADGEIVLVASNLGDGPAQGETMTIADGLPPGLEAVGMTGAAGGNIGLGHAPVNCAPATVSCTFEGTLFPYEPIEVHVPVDVKPGASSGETDTATITGGGGGSASASHELAFAGEPVFGVQGFEMGAEEEGGGTDTQAGSHPFQLTTTLNLNQTGEAEPAAAAKDLNFKLPPGLIGNPTPFPRCTIAEFLAVLHVEGGGLVDECRQETAVGVATVSYKLNGKTVQIVPAPLFNLEPEHGEPARFGFYAAIAPVVLDTSVRTGGDYGVTVSVHNASQLAGFLSSQVTFWGVPGDPRHDNSRGWECLRQTKGEAGTCQPQAQRNPPPLLSLPTSCTGPLQSAVEADPWDRPGGFLAFSLVPPMPGLDGCNRLPFSPEIKVSPDGQQASTPTGLTVDVHVPQEGQLNPTGLAQSNIKDIAVTLPEGVVLNPAAADGLEACSESLVGFEGFKEFEAGNPTAVFNPTLPEPLLQGVNFCSDASKVGTVKIKSPLLPADQPLEGAVYLATPAPNEEEGMNPFKALVAMYIVAKDPISGTLVKLPGRATLDRQTGRIVGTFENTPQLAFEDAEIHFFGGERAPLATPAHCGTYTTSATFTPWSGGAPVKAQSSFEITSGPNHSPCPGAALPFAPDLTAGSSNIQAGSFSPFTMTMSREDGNQNLKSVQLHMPPGLSGILTGIPLCDEAHANAGTCPASSLIGETTVSVGLGGDPFTVKGGQVFLTGKYKDAPFGLSIVNPAKAGPFDLGKVVVRAKLEVDPHTAAVTVTSDDDGPYAIPPSIDGIPLQIKHVNVTIDRAGGFTFNPTNCSHQAITGALNSIEGATQTLSVPFQAHDCATLKFAPKFSASTSGRTSKANGASLSVKLVYPKAPFGSQANIAKVKVDLPKQLPSRLTTLQKACTAAQFKANPAGCPAASIVGYAKATTPLIPVPLEGPAYFVSNGGEAFPNLIVVLQGYGVTVDLVGDTFISKAGITSSTFKTVPDAPVGSFELTLPQKRFSALAANGDLCGATRTVITHKRVTRRVHGRVVHVRRTVRRVVVQPLLMPTSFTAQNGAVLRQTTKIAVTGCPKRVGRHGKGKAKKKG